MKKRIIICLLFITSTFLFSKNTKVNKNILQISKNKLIESYDVFTENNKVYKIELRGENYNTIIFEKNEKNESIKIRGKVGRGDYRYSVRRSGSFKFKFNDDDKIYEFRGYSVYLTDVYANINNKKEKEFLEKLAKKNYVYVKVILWEDYAETFKVNLIGSKKMLEMGKFIELDDSNKQ